MRWYEIMIRKAKSIVKSGEQLVPIFFMMPESGELKIISLSAVSHNKDLMSAFMRMLIKKFNPPEYLFISESYARMLNPDDEGEQAIGKLVLNGTLQVSELPSSEEAIVALYGDRQSERLCMIVFQRKGHKVTFRPAKWLSQADEAKGRFMNLRNVESE